MLAGMMMWRCLLVVLVAVGIPVAPALSAPAKPKLALSRSSAIPGQMLRVTGYGFPAQARVRLVLSGRSLRRLRSGPHGGFRRRIRMPRDVAAGRYTLAARSRGIVVRRRVRVRALSQPAQPAPVLEVPVPATAPSAPAPPADPPTLAAAGDIACPAGVAPTATACHQARTADLIETLAPDAVAPLGDNQYEHGELANFTAVYDPTWGRFLDITHPAVGNHEYEGVPERDAAPGYYSYFGTAAGDASKGYYRWQLGDWTMLVLNSGAINYTRAGGLNPSLPDDCWPVSCAAGSEQEQWLRAELDTLPDDACVLAYWHHPRFSSGFGGANQPHPETGPLFEALYEHGAELLLTGHSHNYERFAAVTPAGTPDPAGVSEFVVGTGGRSFQTPGPQVANSEVLLTGVFGVLELSLDSSSYTARFIREDGAVVDQSTGTCHPPPAAP
jgi:acid phosphatase type 7